MLLNNRNVSREIGANPAFDLNSGARQANNSSALPEMMPRNSRIKRPRSGSLANACTDSMMPERTRNVPSTDNEKPVIESNSVQLLNKPRFSVTASEWISAVPISHGMNDAFSTGSQNHQPPQPSS